MREELKEREAELERSIEDKQLLKNQIDNLKAGLHNLQATRTQKVRRKHTRYTHAKSREDFVCV